MARLKLQTKQRVAYKVTTKRKHSDAVAANLVNQNFNPMGQDQIWAGDITYLKIAKGWVYLAIVMGLYSSRIIGSATDKHMTTDLISRAMVMAYNLRQPFKGLVFHSDRGSQYTSKPYRKLLIDYGIRAFMGDAGACWKSLPHEVLWVQCCGRALLRKFKARLDIQSARADPRTYDE